MQEDDWTIPQDQESPPPPVSKWGTHKGGPGTNGWWNHDLIEGVSKRRSMDAQTSFDMDVALLQSTIDALPKYDEREIRDRVSEMDFSVPKNQFTVASFTEAYDRISRNRQTLAGYRDVVGQHLMVYEKYHKALTDTAAALFKTGTVPERGANAANLTMEVFHGIRQPRALLSYIEDFAKIANDGSFQVNALLKLVEAEMRQPGRGTTADDEPSTPSHWGSWRTQIT